MKLARLPFAADAAQVAVRLLPKRSAALLARDFDHARNEHKLSQDATMGYRSFQENDNAIAHCSDLLYAAQIATGVTMSYAQAGILTLCLVASKYYDEGLIWFMGLSGDRCQAFQHRSLYCCCRNPGFSSFMSAIHSSDHAA